MKMVTDEDDDIYSTVIPAANSINMKRVRRKGKTAVIPGESTMKHLHPSLLMNKLTMIIVLTSNMSSQSTYR